MNYQQSLDYVKSLVPTLERPSLGRIEEFFNTQGRPQSSLECFHVGGTNGKGSVVTLLASMLEAMGHSCGKFTGPHLLSFNERFVVNGNAITPEKFAQVASITRALSDQFALEHPHFGALTWFEFLTAMAIAYFRQEQVRYSVFEVGMGGRFDATNILTNVRATVLTNVELDHMQFLGDTKEKIAFEKSGIIKANVPVVTTCDGAALAVITSRANELQCPVYALCQHSKSHNLGHLFQSFDIQYFGLEHEKSSVRDFVELLKNEFFLETGAQSVFVSGLSGSYQRVNMLTALIALGASGILDELLSSSIDGRQAAIRALKAGLSKATWPGRFEIFEEPKMILDGAHNPHGAKALRAALIEKFGQVNFVFIVTCFENKNADELLHELLAPGDSIIAFAPLSERKMHSPETLVQLANVYGAKGYVVDSYASAVAQGQEILANLAAAHACAPYLIATGSFATVREATCFFKES
ncbi:MAG: Mur ligase family protein [Candidatus Melainabacteria bacterium]|nr:Mur ligase family protein [Candidatus Melainabacteria bacterium]